ncbi:expressed unknown protein [Seminavis robusta]|uniref:Uncharacterized protein n=1 Tax=Seminavis robusta TaxID=568900 RepID=A0A9N8DKZ3_9STRA|nr:expressed unknown protein [Seminavis robusta]|eukprot:Sro187_g080880.1 n/a (926) ;mRNA; f:26319-29096
MSTVTTATMDDFFQPLNLEATRIHDNRRIKKSQDEIPVRSMRSRSIRFADEKEEAELMLETILLFEPDDSFCEASVVEAVMEDFCVEDDDDDDDDEFHEDSGSSFDSWEFAHNNCNPMNMPIDDDDDDDDGEPALTLAQLEQQVRDQQAKELLEKKQQQQQQQQQNQEETKEIPVEIMAAMGGSFTSADKPAFSSATAMSPLNSPLITKEKLRVGGRNHDSSLSILHNNNNSSNLLDGSANNLDSSAHLNSSMHSATNLDGSTHSLIRRKKKKPSRTISSHRVVPRNPNPNLRRALQKSSSLRMLEEAAENRRAREDEIQKRQAAESELQKVQEAQEQYQRLQQDTAAAAGMVSARRASFEPNTSTSTSKKQQSTPKEEEETQKKQALTHDHFAIPAPQKPKEEEEPKPQETTSTSSPKRTGRRVLPRRNRTFDGAGDSSDKPKATRARPKRTVSNFTGPRNTALRRVRTAEPLTRKATPQESQQKPEEEEKKESPKEEEEETTTKPMVVTEQKPQKVAATVAAAKTPHPKATTKAPAAKPSRRASTMTSIPTKKPVVETTPTTATTAIPDPPSPRRVSASGVASIKARLEQQSASAAQHNAKLEVTKVAVVNKPRKSNTTASTTTSASSTALTTEEKAKRVTAKLPKAATRGSSTTTSSLVKSAQEKRYNEIRAVQGLSMVGSNAWNRKTQLVADLQRATRGYLVRQVIQTAQTKIKQLQKHLKAMERAKQQELESIRNSPELQALREEYQAATMTPSQLDLEKEQRQLQKGVTAVQDSNADIQQKMEDLHENNRRIARATRELKYTTDRLKERTVCLQATQDQFRNKVEQLQAKVKSQTLELQKTIRQTETEKQVGWICHCTILQVRQHTKMVASTSQDTFLRKVHKRAQILDQLSKKRSKAAKGKNGGDVKPEEVCPVILTL